MALRAAITTRVAVSVRGISRITSSGVTQLFQFADAKIVGGAQHGWLLLVWKTCRPIKKPPGLAACSDFLAAILQIERDPPTASELS